MLIVFVRPGSPGWTHRLTGTHLCGAVDSWAPRGALSSSVRSGKGGSGARDNPWALFSFFLASPCTVAAGHVPKTQGEDLFSMTGRSETPGVCFSPSSPHRVAWNADSHSDCVEEGGLDPTHPSGQMTESPEQDSREDTRETRSGVWSAGHAPRVGTRCGTERASVRQRGGAATGRLPGALQRLGNERP